MKGNRSQPGLVYALSASLVVSICCHRGMVGCFLVQGPLGSPTATSRAAMTTPSFPRKAPVGRPQPSRAYAAAGAFRHRCVRHSPEALFGVRGVAPRVSGPGFDLGTPKGRETVVGDDERRRRRRHRRRHRCEGLLGAGEVARGEEEEDRNWRGRTKREGNRGAVTREGDGGLDRGGFVRAMVGGLVAGPVIGYAAAGKGVLEAEAATLDRTRLGTPILTESVLLDLLPISGTGADVLREIQSEIETATILRTIFRRGTYSPTGMVVEQLPVPPSVWDRVQYVAEMALEKLDERRSDLEPVFREMDSAETQIRRAEYSEKVFSMTKEALGRIVEGAKAKLTPAVLTAQEDALLGLGRIGELFDSGFPFEIDAGNMYDSIPRLLGRATVDLTLRRDPDTPKEKAKALGNVTMVVDGYSSPVTAGNFIDLALRGFYDELPIRFDGVPTEAQLGTNNNETISTVVGGSYREGFVDPATGALRRLPLEILRVERRGNAPVYGAARNTKVFTKAPAVQTFRIPFAVAMNHPALDGNGASSEFFWLQDENLEKDGYLMDQRVEVLDGRYAIFAYAVGNRKLLGRLKDGDVIERVTVTYGEDNLIRPKTASFTDLLLKGGNGNEDD